MVYWSAVRDGSKYDQDNRTFVNALLNGEVNATQNLALTQGNIILQVT